MVFSSEVLQGLSYLATTSYITEDNFKRIVNSCLGLLAGEPNVEKVSCICPEKSDVIKQIYASLLTFTVEVIHNKSEEKIQNFLGKQNIKSDRIEYYMKVLNSNVDNICNSLESYSSVWSSIVDADWRLDYIVKSNTQNHGESPLYYIILTTEKNGKLDYVKFTCNLHQLQHFSTQLKEIDILVHSEMDGDWNLWDVKPPVICTVKTVLHFKEMTGLSEVTFDAYKTLKDLVHLDREAAVLSRFLYKYQRVYHHDKGMQNLVKIYQCLKRYLKLDFPGVLHTFKRSLPFKFNPDATHAYLPTQQMLKWVLLRLQAFSELFVRLIYLAKEVGTYFLAKSWLGWALNISLMIFSLTARLLATSKYLVKKSMEWYNSLHKYLPFLQKTSDFLPSYNLPLNLKQWLRPVDLSSLKKKTVIDEIFECVDLTEDDEDNEVKILPKKLVEYFFKVEVVDIDSDVEEVVKESESEKISFKRPIETSQYEDLGDPIDVEGRDLGIPRKKKRRNKEGKRFKWLKSVKKTVNDRERRGGNKNSVGGS